MKECLDSPFDDDYYYFDSVVYGDEQNEREAKLIQEIARLTPHSTLLDAPCGYGRIANRLARTCSVTALDSKTSYIKIAEEQARALGVKVRYAVGDIREIRYEDAFDCVLCWWVSFGYNTDEEDRLLLRRFCNALKLGGVLVLDLLNLSGQLRRQDNRRPQIGLVEHEGNLMILRAKYNLETGKNEFHRTVIRTGQRRDVHFGIRLFAISEISCWLRHAGFSRIESFDFFGHPLSIDSERMIIRATK